MNAAKKGLGRGLSALFGDIENKSDLRQDITTNKVRISDLERNKYQPRIIFDDEKLNELSESIKQLPSQSYPSNAYIHKSSDSVADAS